MWWHKRIATGGHIDHCSHARAEPLLVNRLGGWTRGRYKKFLEEAQMDNPVSWFVLLCFAIFAAVWLVKQAITEEEAKKYENNNWFDWGK